MATPVKHRNGLIGTCLFHGMLLLFLFYFAFRTPLPLPEEAGILVEFGITDMGFGSFQPRMSDPVPVRPQQQATPTTQREQNLTQDFEETIAVPAERPRETPRETTPTPPRETPPRETPPVEQPAPTPVERTADPRAMFPGRGDAAASSQGEAGGQGNQGVATGAPNVHVYGEGGDAAGNRWSLQGRGIVGSLPRPEFRVQDQGTVVVEITVDQNGIVTNARSGVRGSTTTNRILLEAAERAAGQASFSANPNTIQQTGTITYIFRLQGE